MRAPRRLTTEEQESQGDLRAKWIAPDREWLRYHYSKLGMSALKISTIVGAGLSGEIVRRWLDDAGLQVREYRKKRPAHKWLYQQYAGLKRSTAELASEFDVHQSTIQGWLRDAGVPKRPPGRYTGNSATWERVKAKRALLNSNVPYRCSWCGAYEDTSLGRKGALNMHHRDHNRFNSNLDNLIWLCFTCHRLETALWHAVKDRKIELSCRNRAMTITFK